MCRRARGTFVRMTVEENLQLGAMTRRDRAGIAADIEQVYAHFPRLKERRAQQAGTLSGGEQQMLAVGRALMLRPRLMLLDEPSFGLAPLIVEELFEILRRLNRERGVAMLIVEQNAALALDLAEHAYLLETGRIVMAGPARRSARTKRCAARIWGIKDGDGTVAATGAGGARDRGDLRLDGARRGDDLPGDRPSQFRAGRDGDVLDLSRLADDPMGSALLGRLYRCGRVVVRRRRRDRAGPVQADPQRADPEPARRLHRALQHPQQLRRRRSGTSTSRHSRRRSARRRCSASA